MCVASAVKVKPLRGGLAADLDSTGNARSSQRRAPTDIETPKFSAAA
jgi:hypothetical protein